jgi:hypothetical protein
MRATEAIWRCGMSLVVGAFAANILLRTSPAHAQYLADPVRVDAYSRCWINYAGGHAGSTNMPLSQFNALVERCVESRLKAQKEQQKRTNEAIHNYTTQRIQSMRNCMAGASQDPVARQAQARKCSQQFLADHPSNPWLQ